MKKITLRTKITLTILGSLALTGVFCAASSSPFGTVSGPIGIAAAPNDLIVTENCSQNLDMMDPMGNIISSGAITIPGPGGCLEKYIAIAPAQSALAVPPWTPHDIFVTQGAAVYQVSGGSIKQFATIPGCPADHTGITFDHVGPSGSGFGYNMIVTCQNGGVWEVDASGSPTLIADVSTSVLALPGAIQPAIEGPAVPPLSFGPYGGQILVADENNGMVHAIDSTGTVTPDVFDSFGTWAGAESVQVIPSAQCTFSSGGTFFQALENSDTIYQYPLADFTGLGGNILVPSEAGAGTLLVTFDGANYHFGFFGDISGVQFEGSAFADCDVPATGPGATPTPTPSPSPTPTLSPSPTPTPSPSPSPTPTPMQFTSFVIGDLDAVVGNHVTFWSAQWWKKNHLSRGGSPASFKGFADSPNPNPPTCGGTWQSDPGNSSHPPSSVAADITVIVSSLVTKSGPVTSGDVPKMVIVHTDPGYESDPGHEGTGTVTAVVCSM